MARTESKRELILANLQTTLEGIDGKEPYWTAVKKVKRIPIIPTDFKGEEKPGLLIAATGEPESIEHKHNFQDVRDLKAGIIGVMNRPANDTGTSINRFMKDVHVAVMADVTRGGNASMTAITSQLDVSNLFGDLCLFEMEVSIRYHCDAREE